LKNLISDRAGYDDAQSLKNEVKAARSALRLQSPTTIPIGVGYLGWQLEMSSTSAVELLSVALEARIKAVWFAFGSDLGQWVEFVRNHDRESRNSHKTLVFVQISSVEEAQRAISEWQVDVIVAQGLSFLLFRILYNSSDNLLAMRKA
jgi:nitronate monooxygenase